MTDDDARVTEPDYLTHHEALYCARRASGRFAGWESGYARSWSTLKRIFGNGHAPASGSVLELGCGAGNTTVWLAQHGHTAAGIDLSPTAIEWARENSAAANAGCHFALGSVLDSNLYPSDIDFILDGHLVHCIIGDDRQLLFANVKRSLCPGGYFLVRHVLSPVDERLPGAYRFDPSTCLLFHGERPYRYLPTFAMLQSELQDAGFVVLGSEITYDLRAGRGFQLAAFELRA